MTTTQATTDLGVNCVAVLLRAPSTNNDNVYVSLNSTFAGAGDIIVQKGDALVFSVEEYLLWKAVKGMPENANDFFKTITTKAASGTQTIYVDYINFQS